MANLRVLREFFAFLKHEKKFWSKAERPSLHESLHDGGESEP